MKDVIKVTLVDGNNWTTLDVRGDSRFAEVIEGTVHQPHDLVMLPRTDLDWTTAAGKKANGDSRISPFDLELAYDSVTQARIIPESIDAYPEGVIQVSNDHPEDPAEWALLHLNEESPSEVTRGEVLRAHPSDVSALLSLLDQGRTEGKNAAGERKLPEGETRAA